MPKRPRTIDVVSEEVYRKLQIAASNNDQSLRQFVNNILTNNTEAQRIFENLFPGIEIISSSDKAIFINDTNLNKVFTITTADGSLSCNECSSNKMCKHIAFTLTQPNLLLRLKETR